MTAKPARNADLVVIGGGIHGLLVAHLAAEAGHRIVLLERGDLGNATTAGWFAILHGGLRYLQSLDLRRYRESLRERRWFMRNFPGEVSTLPFLMPLYGKGLKRNSVFRLAFLLDALLSLDRNSGVDPASALRPGRVLGPSDTRAAFPNVRVSGLKGGALWNEVVAPVPTALFSAIAEKVLSQGVTCLSSATATGLIVENGAVKGVLAQTPEDGEVAITAPRVINVAGAWTETVAKRLDPAYRGRFGVALAFNLLLNRDAPSQVGLSITRATTEGDMLFLYPSGSQSFAGTWYVPVSGPLDNVAVRDEDIEAFIEALNSDVFDTPLTRTDVAAVTSGLLPTHTQGGVDLLSSSVLIDHSAHGGPEGLVSAIGVKYTTARHLAERALRTARMI